MAMHNDELVGSAEVCRTLEINPSTVSRWVEAGRLTPAHKLPGRNGAYLFRRADIDTLVAERAEAAKAAATSEASA